MYAFGLLDGPGVTVEGLTSSGLVENPCRCLCNLPQSKFIGYASNWIGVARPRENSTIVFRQLIWESATPSKAAIDGRVVPILRKQTRRLRSLA
jgi:hypothetical protein